MRWVTMGLVLLAGGLVGSAMAQSTLDWPVGEYQDYALDSGVVANPETEATVVYVGEVHVPEAAWLRLYFRDVQLDRGSTLRMTAALDGEVQELDAAGIGMWSYTSAYFNGDTVYVELIAAPESQENRVILDRLALALLSGQPRACGVDGCGYCGSDDRVPSAETWAGRLLPVGCTGSVFNEDSCIVSAGHCADGGYADVIQFNVPNSQSDCDLVNPPVADQFPITDYLFSNNDVGDDWSVMTCGTNSYGQRPYDRYGEYRPIASSPAPTGVNATVWGYGIDDSPSPTRNQTQQTASGPINYRYSTHYRASVDITYGNSGSALMYNGTIIGIVTHCPCPNYVTRVDLAAFAAAREQLCGGGGGGYCDADAATTQYEYISNVTVGTINNNSGAGTYSDYTGLSTQLQRTGSYAFSLSIGTPYDSDIGGLWIDWNQDEDFSDAGETITTAWSGTGPYTTTINVPSGAVLGATRLRCRIQDGDYDATLSSCGSTDYGEVEDYTVVITEAPPPDYTLTVVTSGSGSVDLDPPGGTYEAGTVVWVHAVASQYWHFDHWDGAIEGDLNPDAVFMDNNKTLYAYFYETDYYVTVTIQGQGSVSLDPPGGVYVGGTWVALTADAADGWHFDHWEGSLTGSNNPANLYVTSNKAVTAVFVEDQGYDVGDLNCDGVVNNFDIAPFVLALTDPVGYQYAYPDCDALNGDVNGDGTLNNFDIGPFVALITGG
ncbi:MAG: GEVED domain-containing protein [Phycisphaerae bacterium]|jgi:hypothetical protein